MYKHIRNLWHKIFFSHVNEIIKTGRERALESGDFPRVPSRINPRNFHPGFQSLMAESAWGFLWRIIQVMKGRFALMLVLVFSLGAVHLMSPVLIHELINLVSNGVTNANLQTGIGLAVLLCIASISEAVIIQHYIYAAVTSEMMIINGLNFRIFDQSLRLTRKSRMENETGDVVNYMGTDSSAAAEFIWVVVELIYALAIVTAVSCMLFYYIGHAAWAAIGTLVLVSPITKVVSSRFARLDDEIMKHRDKRVSLISQILSAIRIVKYFDWGEKFRDEVNEIRAKEVQSRRNLAIASAQSLLVYVSASSLVSLAAFGTYIWLGNSLDAATVFSCLALFALLEHPFGNLTHHLADLAAAKVSGARILKFLQQESTVEDSSGLSAPGQAVGVRAANLSVRYHDGKENVLNNVDFAVAPGEKVAIVGPLGSGKSSLLLTLLNEIDSCSGSLTYTNIASSVRPRTAFVPQEAFVQNGSLRENILFGSDPDGLDSAVKATTLDQDLRLFPAGLDTEIGEHGVNLSGGQKHRVGLARAIMARAGLVLLDDPLAAVDSDTEAKLVRDVILSELKESTVLCVTHRLKHLAEFDRVMFVENGRVTGLDRFEHLMESNPRFAAYVTQHEKEEKSANVQVTHDESGESSNVQLTELRITEDEDREFGAVKASVYSSYLRAMGGDEGWKRNVIIGLLILSSIVVTILPILQTTWLSVWTNSKDENQPAWLVDLMAELAGNDSQNITIYGIISFVILVTFFLQYLFWQLRSVDAGRHLHDKALKAVLGARVRFFDSTPVGRILNRFSRDVDAVERELPWSFESTIRSLFNVVGSILVLTAILPVVTIVVIPVLMLFYRLQNSYRSSAREAQRLNSISRSPRFSHFKETLTGLSVVRGFHKQDKFWDRFYETLEENQKMFHGLVLVNRWFSLRIPLISAAVSLAVSFAILFSGLHGAIMAGTAGMVLIYSLRFWESLNWSIRSFSEAEARMTSVERLNTYAQIKAEPNLVAPLEINGEMWPSKGAIEFKDVSVRYAEHLPLVLKNVSFKVPGGSKVGLIGRTGSGKSTIFQTLFRFINVSSGEILIDGKNIGGIPLSRLRKSVAIIPQDPTLFKGTLRDNLDRFGQYNDEQILDALRRAHLSDFVASLGSGLDSTVAESGHNFSQGQRQLFCLARALLIDAKIIVMDEATASVDIETDVKIQRTISTECTDKTVVLIAHRLGTVADCDLIIELAEGKVKRTIRKTRNESYRILSRSSEQHRSEAMLN